MKHIPNFITSLNLASGFAAIIFAANGDLLTASWLILAAMIFDFFDGFSARMLKAYSEVGKELDSLADVVSFGVAPAFIIFSMLNSSFPGNEARMQNYHVHIPALQLIVAALMPVCAALRLAIFNLDPTQKSSFKGLPTPANAIAVISVVIAGSYSASSLITSLTGSQVFLIIFTIALSLLMVSRITLLSLKVPNLKLKGNEGRYLLLIMIIASFAILGIMAAPVIIPLYIIASLLSNLFWPEVQVG